MDKAREIALKVLKEVNEDGKYANISLKNHLSKAGLSSRDIGLATQLVYGTLEKQITIDWVIARFATLKKVNPWVENILRMGCYQILYLDRIPDSAACNESVKLCKRYCKKPLHGFVNGVLRNIARNKDRLGFPDEKKGPVQYLSIKYGYPSWLVEKWVREYGRDTAESLLKPYPQEDYTTIRVNGIRTNKAELIKLLEGIGVEIKEGLYMENALRIKGLGNVADNPLFKEGLFTVQGESSMLVTNILDPRKGENILDACSAPGGKSLHTAEKMGMQGEIYAWDIHSHRVDLIRRNVERCGAFIVRPEKHDARVFRPEFEEKLDRVLIDAPCSGWGVIHKKPDIKLKINHDQLDELTKVQWEIISACSRYVKPGGVLVYSTCTINLDENDRMVERFLKEFKAFRLDDFSQYLPEHISMAARNKGMLQLIPSRDGIDGFFIAKFRRK